MKRHVLTVLLLVAVVMGSAFAQEDPIPPKRSKGAKVGAIGGFTTGILFLDVKPVNTFLTAGKGAALNEGPLFLTGGAGAAYIMVFKNFRAGGVGMSGSTKSSSVDAAGIRREAKLSSGFGGLTFEYVQPIVERLDVAAGVTLGWGGIDLTLRKSNGGASVWDSTSASFGSGLIGGGPNLTQKISGNFFVWIPAVNVEYAFLGWLGVRLGVSYVGMSFPSWEVDDNYDLSGVPNTVSGKGFMINAGLFIGTF